jgi:hypothetical protein
LLLIEVDEAEAKVLADSCTPQRISGAIRHLRLNTWPDDITRRNSKSPVGAIA